MSETPKKMEFMIMKLSAAELVIASNVAFIESEESYTEFRENAYDSFLFDDIDGGVNIGLGD